LAGIQSAAKPEAGEKSALAGRRDKVFDTQMLSGLVVCLSAIAGNGSVWMNYRSVP
jgi:hypothetical protein